MAAERIEITPSLLREQSLRMEKLSSRFETLLNSVTQDLNQINSSWSDRLSNNFTGKISTAQKSFLGALSMLLMTSESTKNAANVIEEFEQRWSGKVKGKFGETGLYRGIVSHLISKGANTVTEAREKVKGAKKQYEENVPSSVRAWIDAATGKGIGEVLGDWSFAPDVIEKLMDGDLDGALQKLGKTEIKAIAKETAKALGADKGTAGLVGRLAVYSAADTAEAIGAFIENPSLETFNNIGMQAQVQPFIDVVGDDVKKWVSRIPGVSEYYEAHGGLDNMFNTATGELNNLIYGDQEIADYCENYYKESGGLLGGIKRCADDVASYIKDTGFSGAKKFVQNAAEDAKKAIQNMGEEAQIIYKNGGFISSVIKGEKDLIREYDSGFFKKAAKTASDVISKVKIGGTN